MQLGMIGLGRMGANLARRLVASGHECVAYDVSPDAVRQLEGEGVVGSASLEDFVTRLVAPRVVWAFFSASRNASISACGCPAHR